MLWGIGFMVSIGLGRQYAHMANAPDQRPGAGA